MSNPQPDEPCWCGSGISYRTCHLPIDNVPTYLRLKAARGVYSKMWVTNANNIEDQGGYDWMASLLTPLNPTRILDVGCGTGNGVAALLKHFPNATIVSVDENPECIAEARRRLESLGHSVQVVERMTDETTGARSHKLHFQPGKITITSNVVLIESDVLLDQEFADSMLREQKFDAITVWLVGSHRLRYHECDDLRERIGSPEEYRLNVQNVTYRLADYLLRPGGQLQIVDRGRTPDNEEQRDGWLDGHREQATLTQGRMAEHTLEFRSYTEATGERAVQMVVDPAKSHLFVGTHTVSLVSVISSRMNEPVSQ